MTSMLVAPTASSAVGRPRQRAARCDRLVVTAGFGETAGPIKRAAKPSVLASAAATSWSLASYDDATEEHWKCAILGRCSIGISPTTPVEAIMSTDLTLTTPRTPIEDVQHHFSRVSGMPVVNPNDNTLIGVVSKKDLVSTWSKATRVQDVMSSPAIAVQRHVTVMEVACLMLKYKVHRLPVVDEGKHVIGIVTQTDLFAALGMFA